MRVASAGLVRFAIATMRRRAQIVQMIGDGFYVIKGIRIEMLTSLPLIPCAWNHVIQVGNNAGGDKRLTMRIEIDSPGIAGAVREDFPYYAK